MKEAGLSNKLQLWIKSNWCFLCNAHTTHKAIYNTACQLANVCVPVNEVFYKKRYFTVYTVCLHLRLIGV